MARYAPDGSLDAGFGGGGGKVAVDFGVTADGFSPVNSLAVQPDGRLLAGGNVCHPNYLVRYEMDGSLDASFGDGGKLTDDSGDGRALIVSDDGKITTAGESRGQDGHFSGDFVVMRYYTGPNNVPPMVRKDLKSVRKNGHKEFNVLKNDSDPDGDEIMLARSLKPRHGDARCAARGACVYRPDPGYRGRDSFIYHIRDGHEGADSATVRIRVGRDL